MKLPPIVHERRIQLLALLGGAPAVALALGILWFDGYSPKVQWTCTLLVLTFWLGAASAVRDRVANPLRTLANLLEAVREGDYSIRARSADDEDALGEVMQQVNAIGSTLRAQRLGALEATTLLRKVMEEIDVAVFTFDSASCLRYVNRAGERLLAAPSERMLGHDAKALGLGEVLAGAAATLQLTFPGATGRWNINRSVFREDGLPHQLLVLSDVTRALREEELQAWQRIVRVLGHELNNSLTPIKSIAGSLIQIVKREPLAEDWREDTQRGLEIIANRSDGLSRFLASYAQLAKLPRPQKSPVALRSLIEHVAALETRAKVTVDGPDVIVNADAAQIEQVLINLVRNAVDAGGPVSIEWVRGPAQIEINVLDNGQGLASTANLFVPFFTTKPGGSGIGLVLSRQIAEAHGGSLTLANRTDGPGCAARLMLPGELIP